MHATSFLKSPGSHKICPVVVLWGPELHLKQAALRAVGELVLGRANPDEGLTRFAGKTAELKTVCDELLTLSMFSDARLIVVDDADEFVKNNRAGLESYLARPGKRSVLVLMVNSWPKNTRLAKQVSQIGLDVECSPLSGRDLIRWLVETSQQTYGRQLPQNAATLLVELSGNDLSLLNQELAKLAAYVGDRATIRADDVHKLVGGWKAETTWTMTNAVRDGNLGLALNCLNKLERAGEPELKTLAGIVYVFRKLAVATELSRDGRPLNTALKETGVFPRDIAPSAGYLRRIGRSRAERLYRLLLAADADLKGGSRLPSGMQLERLLVQLSVVGL